jgi:membrane protein DedA with SNARE-associated domain/rhodanese-related sulfurtransferase
MPTEALATLLHDHAPALVFWNVLFEQFGLPIPAVPTMVLAGALGAQVPQSLLAVCAAALVACVASDSALYLVGRRYGHRVMRGLCSISLSPDSCVRQTSLHFERWGGWTLVLGKFLPGIGTVAPPLAGVMRVGWLRYLLLSGIGSALWVGLAVGAGVLFHAQVNEIVAKLEDLGAAAIAVVGALLAAFIAFKWWERQRFYKTVRMARITVDELRSLIERKQNPVIVDLRVASDRARDGGSIPGARPMELSDVDRQLKEFPKDREIVFFCNCPNEASAASAAKVLMDLGYTRVRPLLGGIDAWIAAGHRLEVTRSKDPL